MAEFLKAGGGFVPGRYGIDAYGKGGFRFADMSHRGSILVLPSGIRAWEVATPAELTPASLTPVIDEAAMIELLLIGSGLDPIHLSDRIKAPLREAGIRVDLMATGAAARTYNILLAEDRRVAAALIAVP